MTRRNPRHIGWRGLWVLMAGVVAVGMMASPAGAKASKACTKALDTADHLELNWSTEIDARSDAQQATVTALTSGQPYSMALSGVTTAINDLTPKLRALGDLRTRLLTEYRTAAKRCRAGR